MRRIVFSIAFFRKKLPVQSTPTSTKSRWKFYTKVGHRSFHTVPPTPDPSPPLRGGRGGNKGTPRAKTRGEIAKPCTVRSPPSTRPCAWRGGGANIQPDKFFNNRFSAVDANTCILANRSLLPVSSVNTDSAGPATAMQLWPAASP
jgi:hypothetical protein